MIKMTNLLVLIFISLSIFYAGVAMATSEPKYSIEKKNAVYEIRKYDSIIVAETTIVSLGKN